MISLGIITKSLNMNKKLYLLLIVSLLPGLFSCIGIYLNILPAVFYVLSKLTFLGLPFIFWKLKGLGFKKICTHYKLNEGQILFGIASGLVIGGLILLCYFNYFKDHLSGRDLKIILDEFNMVKYFWLFAVFISFWNSFLEEYYWRMFVLEFSEGIFFNKIAMILWNGFFFSIHHFFILLSYLSVQHALIFSVGTIFGGMIWAWMRLKGMSIWQCYVSHVLVDLSVMFVGYQLIK